MSEREKLAVELLPCPFCGGGAHIERYGNHRVSTQYHCDECGCSLETGEEFNHGAGWNKRASPPPIPDGREETEQLRASAASPAMTTMDFERDLLMSMALAINGLSKIGKMTNDEVLAITNRAFARIDERRASQVSRPDRGTIPSAPDASTPAQRPRE